MVLTKPVWLKPECEVCLVTSDDAVIFLNGWSAGRDDTRIENQSAVLLIGDLNQLQQIFGAFDDVCGISQPLNSRIFEQIACRYVTGGM